MNKLKVLVSDDVHPFLIQELSKIYSIDYKPGIMYDEVKQVIHQYTGLIINSKIKCNADFLDRASQLKFIGRLGSGREVVDISYAVSKGIKVYFSPEGNKNAVAEQCLGMLLALANQLIPADREVRKEIWERETRRGWELSGKVIGIIGYGHTGSQFAKKLQGLEMTVMTYDKYKINAVENLPFIQESTLEEILHYADIISFHLPLASDTFHYANDTFFTACKKGTIIMNTSRGNVIDTSALISALESGHLGGACLDVFENEKPHSFSVAERKLYQKLYQMDQVVLSPHIAGWTHESKLKMASVLVEKILLKD